MKQSKGVRLFFQGLLFLLGISVLFRLFGNWSPQEDPILNLQLVLYGLVIVALMVSQLMEAIGLGKWAWVVYLILLPVTLANVVGLHLADYLGVLDVQERIIAGVLRILETQDRLFFFAYMTFFTDLLLLITSWNQRENVGMSDELEDEPHRLSS